MLATGCYDGQARVWSKSGGLKATLSRHQGPVFAIKWSPNGSYLATGGVDSSVLIWDAQSNEVKQELAMHKGWGDGRGMGGEERVEGGAEGGAEGGTQLTDAVLCVS